MSLDRQGTVAKAGAPVGVWCDCRVQVNAPSVTFVWGYTWWNWENDGGQSAQQLWQRTCWISLWWAWFKAIYLSDFRKELQHRAASKASIHSSDWFWQHIPSPQIGSNLACETILSHQVKKKKWELSHYLASALQAGRVSTHGMGQSEPLPCSSNAADSQSFLLKSAFSFQSLFS